MDKRRAAHALEQIASFLELKQESAFRIRAFTNAARAIKALPIDLDTALADGSLADARGVGPATLRIVTELVQTGRSSMLEELREQVPPGLIEMLGIPGLGVARIRQIHQTLGIDSLGELEAAARDGRLARLPRFGPRTAENLLRSLAFIRQTRGLRLAHHAAEEAHTLQADMARLEGITAVHVAGEVRRRCEVVGDIVLVLVSGVAPEQIWRRLASFPGVSEFAEGDERRATLRFVGGASARVVVTPPANLGAVLVQATGSEAHLAQLTLRAQATGHTLDATALWQGSRFVPTPDEAAFYRSLGLEQIPPELREGTGEIEAAAAGRLPALIQREDLRGVLHCHTTYSDGSASVEQLARECRELGYGWLGITDHSQAAAYAGGLTASDLARQAGEIDAVNARTGEFRILKGIETDILADGSLDHEDATLARLDFVIGSVHGRFNLDRAAMTARMLRALDNPRLAILGHPTGRLLLSRKPYELDLDAVLVRAAERGVAVEINADPHRLDLNWQAVRRARDLGVRISIGADAHSLAGLANVEYGLAVARKAGLEAGDVLNNLPAEEFLTAIKRRG